LRTKIEQEVELLIQQKLTEKLKLKLFGAVRIFKILNNRIE